MPSPQNLDLFLSALSFNDGSESVHYLFSLTYYVSAAAEHRGIQSPLLTKNAL